MTHTQCIPLQYCTVRSSLFHTLALYLNEYDWTIIKQGTMVEALVLVFVVFVRCFFCEISMQLSPMWIANCQIHEVGKFVISNQYLAIWEMLQHAWGNSYHYGMPIGSRMWSTKHRHCQWPSVTLKVSSAIWNLSKSHTLAYITRTYSETCRL